MTQQKNSMDSPFSEICTRSKLKSKMGLHWVLTKLGMASMHSSRTQCCCCAIGVFAALFGIIMLSAGICIVLNVNYMEVDTSGLPPDLHNEDGKKVVGIILICVAIGTLGLSVTVSIVYFAMCNGKPRRAVLNTNAADGVGTEGARNGGSRDPPVSQNNRSAATNQRGPDAQRNSTGSQHSLNSLPRQRRPSPSVTPAKGAAGLRKKVQKKNHRKRHPRYHTGLTPHMEEPETGKSQSDLKLHQGRPSDTPSGSHSNLAHGYPSTSHTVDETQMASTSNKSFSAQPMKSENPPVIVISDSHTGYQHGTSNPPVTEALAYSTDMTDPSMSFSDANTAGESLILTEESTLYDEAEMDEPSATHLHSNIELKEISSDVSTMDSNDINNRDVDVNNSHPIPSSDFSNSIPEHENLHPVSTSPDSMLPSSVDIIQEGEQSSVDLYSHDVVNVQPSNNSNSDFTSYPQSAVSDKNSHSSGQLRENDQLSELPTSSRHHEMYADLNDNDSDRRCESQSSFNSAFSNDGGDPGDEDMKRMHEKMRELL